MRSDRDDTIDGPRPLRRWAVTALRVVTATAAAAVLLTTGLGWAAQHQLTTGLIRSGALDVLTGGDRTSQHGDSNILLIGLDSRKDMHGNDLPPEFVTDELHAGDSDVGGYNTNTLILLHVPGDGSRATAAAIPRDDYVEVPGYGKRKIKEAYGAAKADADAQLEAQGVTDPAEREQRARDAGRRSTLKTVQNLLHVPIDHFAEVNLVGFYDIAKALGPLEVCLNAPVDDPYSGAQFPAGKQSLDPSQALSFVRQRHGLDNGDLDRTRRQQAFLTAVIRNLDSAGVFGSVSKMRGLFDTVKSDVVVDDDLEPVAFATHARNLTKGELDFYTLPIEGYRTIDGAAVNIVDPNRLRTEVSRLFAGEGPAPSTTATTTPTPTTTTTPPVTSSRPTRSGSHTTTTTTEDTSTPLEAPPPEQPVAADDSGGIPCVD
ncbi:LCP family protein required for cell wall assembly [Rhodococcus sp. LBL1]|nr:LCP family protein required for cell wall assembly [Rhodococcus sp. LBL1]MDH6682872.1 LCP family protein required for cell wall assembly [Rhodococcus sp. LBL2]